MSLTYPEPGDSDTRLNPGYIHQPQLVVQALGIARCASGEAALRQVEDLFRKACAKRAVDTAGVEMDDEPIHSGKNLQDTIAALHESDIELPL